MVAVNLRIITSMNIWHKKRSNSIEFDLLLICGPNGHYREPDLGGFKEFGGFYGILKHFREIQGSRKINPC